MPKENEQLFDRRVVGRNLRSGALAIKDYERYLKSLDDDRDNAIPVETSLDSSGQTPKTSEDGDDE